MAWNVLFQGLRPHLCLYNEWNKVLKRLFKCLLSLQIAWTHKFLESKCIKPTANVPKEEAGALVEVQSPLCLWHFIFSPSWSPALRCHTTTTFFLRGRSERNLETKERTVSSHWARSRGGEEKSLKQTRQGKKKAQPRFFFHVKKEGGSGFFFFTCRGIVLVSSLVFRLFSRLYSASQPPFPASPGTSACTRAARCRQRVRWANLIPLAEKLYVSTSVSRVRRTYF